MNKFLGGSAAYKQDSECRSNWRPACAVQQLSSFGFRRKAGMILPTSTVREARDVDSALKLNVLAVCAVFAFVGAILVGAF